MVQPDVAAAGQAGRGLAASPEAAGAPAEELPPLDVTPGVAAAVRKVIAAEVVFQAAEKAYLDLGPCADLGDDLAAMARLSEAERAVHVAIGVLQREVCGGADGSA